MSDSRQETPEEVIASFTPDERADHLAVLDAIGETDTAGIERYVRLLGLRSGMGISWARRLMDALLVEGAIQALVDREREHIAAATETDVAR